MIGNLIATAGAKHKSWLLLSEIMNSEVGRKVIRQDEFYKYTHAMSSHMTAH